MFWHLTPYSEIEDFACCSALNPELPSKVNKCYQIMLRHTTEDSIATAVRTLSQISLLSS
jgi:hypothetical protein